MTCSCRCTAPDAMPPASRMYFHLSHVGCCQRHHYKAIDLFGGGAEIEPAARRKCDVSKGQKIHPIDCRTGSSAEAQKWQTRVLAEIILPQNLHLMSAAGREGRRGATASAAIVFPPLFSFCAFFTVYSEFGPRILASACPGPDLRNTCALRFLGNPEEKPSCRST